MQTFRSTVADADVLALGKTHSNRSIHSSIRCSEGTILNRNIVGITGGELRFAEVDEGMLRLSSFEVHVLDGERFSSILTGTAVVGHRAGVGLVSTVDGHIHAFHLLDDDVFVKVNQQGNRVVALSASVQSSLQGLIVALNLTVSIRQGSNKIAFLHQSAAGDGHLAKVGSGVFVVPHCIDSISSSIRDIHVFKRDIRTSCGLDHNGALLLRVEDGILHSQVNLCSINILLIDLDTATSRCDIQSIDGHGLTIGLNPDGVIVARFIDGHIIQHSAGLESQSLFGGYVVQLNVAAEVDVITIPGTIVVAAVGDRHIVQDQLGVVVGSNVIPVAVQLIESELIAITVDGDGLGGFAADGQRIPCGNVQRGVCQQIDHDVGFTLGSIQSSLEGLILGGDAIVSDLSHVDNCDELVHALFVDDLIVGNVGGHVQAFCSGQGSRCISQHNFAGLFDRQGAVHSGIAPNLELHASRYGEDCAFCNRHLLTGQGAPAFAQLHIAFSNGDIPIGFDHEHTVIRQVVEGFFCNSGSDHVVAVTSDVGTASHSQLASHIASQLLTIQGQGDIVAKSNGIGEFHIRMHLNEVALLSRFNSFRKLQEVINSTSRTGNSSFHNDQDIVFIGLKANLDNIINVQDICQFLVTLDRDVTELGSYILLFKVNGHPFGEGTIADFYTLIEAKKIIIAILELSIGNSDFFNSRTKAGPTSDGAAIDDHIAIAIASIEVYAVNTTGNDAVFQRYITIVGIATAKTIITGELTTFNEDVATRNSASITAGIADIQVLDGHIGTTDTQLTRDVNEIIAFGIGLANNGDCLVDSQAASVIASIDEYLIARLSCLHCFGNSGKIGHIAFSISDGNSGQENGVDTIAIANCIAFVCSHNSQTFFSGQLGTGIQLDGAANINRIRNGHGVANVHGIASHIGVEIHKLGVSEELHIVARTGNRHIAAFAVGAIRHIGAINSHIFHNKVGGVNVEHPDNRCAFGYVDRTILDGSLGGNLGTDLEAGSIGPL